MKIKKFSELKRFETKNKWLVDKLILNQGRTLVVGEPKVGKSFWVWDLAISICTDKPALDKYTVSKPQRVLVANLEDSEQIQRERIESIAKAKGITEPLENLGILSTQSLKLDNPDDIAKLRASISEFGPNLVIIDCLVRAHSGSESSSQHVAGILAELTNIKNASTAGIVLIHHTTKQNKKSVGANVRGSGEAFAWCDTLIMLQNEKGSIGMSVTHRAAESFTDTLELVKVNDATTIKAKSQSSIESQETNFSEPFELQILNCVQSRYFPVSLQDIARRTKRELSEVRNLIFFLIKAGKIKYTPKGYLLGDYQ